MSQTISAEVALERSLPLVARTTADLLHVPACSVWLYNAEGRLVERARFGREPDGVCRRSDVLLRVERRVLGVLRVTHASLQQTFSPSEQKLLDTITAQVVSLLERARLIEETSQVRALAESDRLKSTLLTSVSHDLRTPLAVIKGVVTDLLDSSVMREPAAQLDMLRVVNEEADRLNRLVGNLLTMSRLEAGAVSSPHSRQDVGELLRIRMPTHVAAIGIMTTIAISGTRPLWRPRRVQPGGHRCAHCRQHGVGLRLCHPPVRHRLRQARLAGRDERIHDRVERRILLTRNLSDRLAGLELCNEIGLIHA